MAKCCMVAGILGFPIAVCFKPVLIDLALPYYGFLGSIIAFYQTLVTKHDLENKDNS